MTQGAKALIFDLDGTLLDTCADLGAAVNRVFARRGIPTHPIAAYRDFIGSGARTLVARALCDLGTNPDLVEVCFRDFLLEYSYGWHNATAPYPGIMELLAALVGRGIPIAILTNKPQAAAHDCVAHFFPAIPFVAVAGEGPGRPPKPDPAGALEVVRSLGLEPCDVLYVGDMTVDMLLAKRAGFAAAAALWGYHTREQLQEAGAEIFLEAPGEILGFFDE